MYSVTTSQLFPISYIAPESWKGIFALRANMLINGNITHIQNRIASTIFKPVGNMVIACAARTKMYTFAPI